ncbi:Mitochondrial inner membrane protease atp23, partial [Ascosphaera atra]
MSDSQPEPSSSSSQSQPQNPPNGGPQNDPKVTGYVPGDDAWTICKNLYRYAKGNMTQDGIRQFKIDSDKRNEEADCKRCEESRDFLLQY